MSSLPKPVLRGHVHRKGFRALVGAVCFSVMNASLYHFFVVLPRRKAQEDFMKTYDAEAHYRDLVKWNYITIENLRRELKGE